MSGSVQAAQDISFPAMKTKVEQFFKIVKEDPAIDTVSGSVGGSGGFGGSVQYGAVIHSVEAAHRAQASRR